MVARKRIGAAIFVSSIASVAPIAGFTTYCATKTFQHFLGEGLNFEMKGKIDCMSWQPGEIKTKMLDSLHIEDPSSGNKSVISCDRAVKDML